MRLSFKYDAEKFPSGIPDVRFVVRGRSDVYDPRNGAVGYSANTALLILWYLRNRCAIPDDEIIFDSFASSANVCDEPCLARMVKFRLATSLARSSVPMRSEIPCWTTCCRHVPGR